MQQLFEKRQHFYKLLSSISRKFLSIPTDQIEKEFPGALQSIARNEDIDRCSLGMFSDSEGMLRIVADAKEYSVGTLPKDAEYHVSWLQARMKDRKLTS